MPTKDLFDIHHKVIQDYKDFVNSFIHIRDEHIEKTVRREIAKGKFWPEPLIQFNPAFKKGESLQSLCDRGVLHAELRHIFKGYSLFQHQVEAIDKGTAGKDFIVTSGTGSGKSLTYIGTIFHELLQNPHEHGVKAVIVYPMNALINSQTEEFDKYKSNYKDATGRPFPITYAQYTGQEKQDERERIKENIPDILLTNYMMLELILTRSGEDAIRHSIFDNLKILVFDELHTYRGRQGADVSLLIRRIKSQCRRTLICIGTSATMVSGGPIEEQKCKVAEIGNTIFGSAFSSDQIIIESLARNFSVTKPPDTETLKQVLSQPIPDQPDVNRLSRHPLSHWLENRVALLDKEGILVRNQPMQFDEIVDLLSRDAGVDKNTCAAQLRAYLQWLADVNSSVESTKAVLPYKIHQFMSQTGTVYASLEADENRIISLDPANHKMVEDEKIPLFPVVFSRISGHEYLCVDLDRENGRLIPREFENTTEENEDVNAGYLIIGEDIWDPENDIELLPDSWGKVNKDGNFKPTSKYKNRLPQPLYFDKYGNFSTTEPRRYKGWFMGARLLFDPPSGVVYHGSTSENAKLARLGSEGRSSSTTILSYTLIKQMHEHGIIPSEQKLLSFTDNRQDAALQAGHFNDFIQVVRLRSAIYSALQKQQQLDFRSLDEAIYDALDLPLQDYSDQQNPFPGVLREIETALKKLLFYRAIYDLRFGWRVNLPNLEQCALLSIDYQNLDENCRHEEGWKKVPLLKDLEPSERKPIIYQILDAFRKNYALYNDEFLSERAIRENAREFISRLKQPWCLADQERIPEPVFVRYEKLPKHKIRHYTVSIGPTSALGQYLKRVCKQYGATLRGEEYILFAKTLLDVLTDAGWLYRIAVKNARNEDSYLYQLRLDQVIWRVGDQKTIIPDKVRSRSYKEIELQPNPFFQKLYKTDFGSIKRIEGREHTGQLNNDDRKVFEQQFRDGALSALFCSPTMELGIDIANLNVVHMRNVPPNPANYAQRGGRAGRSGQAALVFTNCSTYSPHDRHYFKHNRDMVAGQVAAPKIDLTNKELIETHLNALFIAHIGLEALNQSIMDLIEGNEEQTLPLKNEVRERFILGIEQKDVIKDKFSKVLYELVPASKTPAWLTEQWLDAHIQSMLNRFDASIERWRRLYHSANRQLAEARAVIDSGLYKSHSREMTEALKSEKQAIRQRELLRNPLQAGGGLSEFYPYRYLASEGFLPGYNFIRLPLRAFVPVGDSGDYLSRSRFIALSEYGPRNMIYHNGNRYQVEQVIMPEIEKHLTRAKVSKNSGYFLWGEEYNFSNCPLTKVPLTKGSQVEVYTNLLEMSETRTRENARISCEEEERLRQGYDIHTYFSIPGGVETVRMAHVQSDGQLLLRLRYIPAARLFKINNGWRNRKEKGFVLGLQTGFWKKTSEKKEEMPQEPVKTIKLFTFDTADALYIEPVKALALEPDGVIALQYALKRAIENLFQVESSEIGVELMGADKTPNIFLYEAAEGSLGVLSQFMDDTNVFKAIIYEAYNICRFDDPEYKELASYDDLLSYYNQRYHEVINRFAIQNALEKLKTCSVELMSTGMTLDYDEQYQHLIKTCDQNSQTEKRFLDYLYKNGLRLPDAAQTRTEDIYSQPDFFYQPDIYVFCDGTPHDDPEVQERDRRIRSGLRQQGKQVIVYYYKESLKEVIERRPDIFKKVR
ncbi:DEAD/DEAH box helicase [candidate division KSB1 bacterium]|nr:DEAD/DEAH box helicase [candidate division KSB1 bacterium]